MFVSRAKYRNAVAKIETLALALEVAAHNNTKNYEKGMEWREHANALEAAYKQQQHDITMLQGELAIARMAGANRPGEQFTQDQIRSLLSLVHPDKHDGKESAVRMTQLLLKMRK